MCLSLNVEEKVVWSLGWSGKWTFLVGNEVRQIISCLACLCVFLGKHFPKKLVNNLRHPGLHLSNSVFILLLLFT